jgi:hypothetical protein
VVAESTVLVGAVALAVLVVAHVAVSARGALLFSDGDSMLPVLFVRSFEAGDGQDWAMSSVLFVPELSLFGAIWKLGLGADWTIAINGVVNLVALYVALRCVAGGWFRSRAGAFGAGGAFAVFAVLALLDRTADRDSLELASLLTTPTYYSATVIAVVASIALVRTALGGRGRPGMWVAVLALVAVLSVMSNPLYLLWATIPLTMVVVVVAVIDRHRFAGKLAVVLVAASGFGYALRIPFAPHIANDGLGYVDLGGAGASAGYYGALVGDMFSSVGGAASMLGISGLIATAAYLSHRAWMRRDRPALVVTAAGWVIPVLVVAAAILLGTHAARYLQPVVFAPLAALSIAPALLRLPRGGPVRASVVAAIASTGLLVGASLVIPAIASTVDRPDRDLWCVTNWVDRSGRVGAGQYWSVRLPKAHLDDPRQLVQVDALLQPYNWLVDRTDASVRAVSFLLVDADSIPFALGGPADPKVIGCGRYQILDFGDRPLALGTPHS